MSAQRAEPPFADDRVQTTLRMPTEWRDELQEWADANERSWEGEARFVLRYGMDALRVLRAQQMRDTKGA